MNGFLRRFTAEIGWAAVAVIVGGFRVALGVRGGWRWDLGQGAAAIELLAMLVIPLVCCFVPAPDRYWPRARRMLAAIYAPLAVLMAFGPMDGAYGVIAGWMVSALGGLVGLVVLTIWWLAIRTDWEREAAHSGGSGVDR